MSTYSLVPSRAGIGRAIREALGSLVWLAIMSRPDIAVSVGALARVTNDPWLQQWKNVLKVLAYVAGTRDSGLTYWQGGTW